MNPLKGVGHISHRPVRPCKRGATSLSAIRERLVSPFPGNGEVTAGVSFGIRVKMGQLVVERSSGHATIPVYKLRQPQPPFPVLSSRGPGGCGCKNSHYLDVHAVTPSYAGSHQLISWDMFRGTFVCAAAALQGKPCFLERFVTTALPQTYPMRGLRKSSQAWSLCAFPCTHGVLRSFS